MTIKQYAESRGVSYEATRKTIQKYAKELTDHITTKGRSRILDDDAISILDQHRTKTAAPSTEINQEQLYINELHREIIRLQAEIISLRTEYQTALLDANTARLALESETRETEKIKAELSTFQPTIFGLYKKAKKA